MLAGQSTLILHCIYRMGGNAGGMKTVSVTSRKLTDVPGSSQMKTIGMWGDPCINRVSGVVDQMFWSYSLEASVRRMPSTSLGFILVWGGRKEGH